MSFPGDGTYACNAVIDPFSGLPLLMLYVGVACIIGSLVGFAWGIFVRWRQRK